MGCARDVLVWNKQVSAILKCRGLEKALDQIEAERSAKSGVDAAAMAKAAGIEVCECRYCHRCTSRKSQSNASFHHPTGRGLLNSYHARLKLFSG